MYCQDHIPVEFQGLYEELNTVFCDFPGIK